MAKSPPKQCKHRGKQPYSKAKKNELPYRQSNRRRGEELNIAGPDERNAGDFANPFNGKKRQEYEAGHDKSAGQFTDVADNNRTPDRHQSGQNESEDVRHAMSFKINNRNCHQERNGTNQAQEVGRRLGH